uniref:Uncharacterized protein n=1 Tax=Arundo donax TaxID=35708 RepID=A0A0A9E4S0_ARUDO
MCLRCKMILRMKMNQVVGAGWVALAPRLQGPGQRLEWNAWCNAYAWVPLCQACLARSSPGQWGSYQWVPLGKPS